jgi:hypothetical protein
MLGILVSLIILLVVFAIAYWIIQQIPIPAQFVWIVRVVLGLIFLIAIIELFTGGYSLFPGHLGLR